MPDITLEVVQTPHMMVKLLNKMATLLNELRTDHGTFRTHCAEIESWAETLAAKLNADGGVTDVNYDATITNSPPAAISASAITVSK